MSAEFGWYFAQGQQSVGPMSLQELVRRLPEAGGLNALVYGLGMASWIEAKHVQAVAEGFKGKSGPPAPPTRRRSDEIDYEIFGEEMQYVEVTLDPNEMVIAEAGGMMYMTPGIKKETVFGDPSQQQQGFFGKLMTAGKRALTGESLFMTTFTCTGPGRQHVAFAAPYPGKILPIDLSQVGGIKNTLFGGEGLFFATLTGPGDIWCQSLPFSRLAGRVLANASGLGRKDEGSILGGLGSLIGGSTD